MARERLQKVIARAGVASRRRAEELIRAGRVRVNGRVVCEMGTKVDAFSDRVELDGRRLVAEKPAYYVAHKPRKMVSTLDDPQGRATLADLCARVPEAVHPVGRLDYHTSGVLLLTNDGALTEALLRPSSRVPKTYIAKVQGDVDAEALDRLRNGVELDDGYRTKPAEIVVDRFEGGQSWLRITLQEGKNRQIHRMLEATGHRVMRLARLSFAGISSGGLRPGEVRPLRKKEIERLEKHYLKPHRARRAKLR